MRTCKSIAVLFLLLFLTKGSFAQSSAAFQSLIYPRSVSSQGLGEQGVASRNPIDAMEYNPANLIYEEGLSLSMYKNPWEILSESFGSSLPLESFVAAVKVNNVGNFGFEYTDRDYGTVELSTPANTPQGYTSQEFHFYEQSFAGGYAIPVSDEFAAGVQLRYVREPLPLTSIDHLLISAGIGYKPEFFDNRLNIAFSLMNLGTRINYPSYTDTLNGEPVTHFQAASPPANLNVGVEVSPFANHFFDLSIFFSAKKPLEKNGGAPDYVAESSFKALFNDWSDFPNDVTGQIGLSYVWHPIYLGGGLSYFQEMYVGYFSVGPKDSYNSFYTHGINVGLEARRLKVALGYAGRWYNNNAGSYMTWDFPWETFQLTLRANAAFFEAHGEDGNQRVPAKRILMSGGFGYGVFVGRMKGKTESGNSGDGSPQYQWTASDSWSPRPVFSLETDFYFTDDAAVTTSFAYTRIKRTASWHGGFVGVFSSDLTMETLALTSGLRFHPLSGFRPFFIQGDIGIIRLNPIPTTSPRYNYSSQTDLVIGAIIPVVDTRLFLMPAVSFKSMFLGVGSNGSRLGAYNQFVFGINAGYRL